jgi:hypothetical protein
LTPELRGRLRQHRDAVLAELRHEAFEGIARGPVVAQYVADGGKVWEWLLTYRNDLVHAIKGADQGPLLTEAALLEAALRAGLDAFKTADGGDSR